LFGATLAVTSGFGLASMAGSAVAQTQEGTVYLRDAHIGASDSRGNITSREGWLYFETDTGDIYYDNDGSGWQDLGGDLGSRELTVIDSNQSTYSTEGSSVVYVDTSSTGESVRLTIDAANEVNGAPLEVYDTGENAGTHPITIENSSGELVTELGVDRAYTELIYQDPRWLVKTSKGEGIWNTYTESDSAIPDSEAGQKLIHRWYLSEDSGPFVDQIGSANVTDNGTTQKSGDWVDGEARQGDGASAYLESSTMWGSFGSQLSDPHAFAFSIQTTQGSQTIAMSQDNGNGERFRTGLNVRSATDSGKPSVTYRGSNGYVLTAQAEQTINDGNPHRVVINKLGNTGSDAVEIYIDGSAVSTTIVEDQGFAGMGDFVEPPRMLVWENLAGGGSGDFNGYLDGSLDDPCVYNDSLTSTEATSYDPPW
jgi:hypothetical protein